MDELGSQLAVRTQVVYDALQWLCLHNEDYATVTVDHSEFERWPPVFIVQELVECMGEISDNIMEEMARAGVAVDDTHEGTVGHGDEEITVSGVMDVNNVSQSENATTLRRLASLSEESTINVVPGSTLLSQWDDPSYFTASSPSMFPFGSGKHIDDRRKRKLTFHKWTKGLLNHVSGYASSAGLTFTDL
jgi:hypothetical protein